jgi:2-isopropylmalate synthase
VAPRIHVFVNSSDVQLAQQLRKTRDDVLEMAEYAVRRARHYTDDVEFSPMDATRADAKFIQQIVRVALDAGARTINVPDTVGYVLPDRLARLLAELRERLPELEEAVLSFHGQDDLGLATANALAAIGAGARQVEVAMNGIGERAGNTPFEEVVMAIHVHGASMGVHTNVDTSGIASLSRLVAERSGVPVPPNKAIVGGNAFRHASGIHQDGVLKFRETYEVIDPAVIGHPRGSEIVLGKLSGRAGFVARIRELGIELPADGLDGAFRRFQAVANHKRIVGDEDLRAICAAL